MVGVGPAHELRERVARLLGARGIDWRRVHGGYTPAERWVVLLDDGRSAFVKAAVDELTGGWLRAEALVYQAVHASFMPALLGWDGVKPPVLALEDLSGATWPPPWDRAGVDAVVYALSSIAATKPPPELPGLRDSAVDFGGWRAVADDPEPFLSLGLVGSPWLAAALPDLIGAAEAFAPDGRQLLHLDVRSDNLCLRDGVAVLVDWNFAAVGNARLDVAFWLPSLADEGGPQPEAILPDAGPEAAVVSGYFAARSGLALIPTAPRVRSAQLAQLRQALPWVCRELGLPQPG